VATPSFTFRLERVRSIREKAEDEAREQLARELQHRARGEAILREAAQQLSDARDSGRAASSSAAISGASLLAAQAFIERAEHTRAEAAGELRRLESEVDRRRDELVTAQRDREAIERLKRRRREDFDAEMQRREQGDLDEIALGMHRRAQLA
jgi:flagellar FliJ protein